MCFAHCTAALAQGKKEHAITSQLCLKCSDSCFSEACGKFPDDKQMADCAKSCRECAAACQAMVKAAGTT